MSRGINPPLATNNQSLLASALGAFTATRQRWHCRSKTASPSCRRARKPRRMRNDPGTRTTYPRRSALSHEDNGAEGLALLALVAADVGKGAGGEGLAAQADEARAAVEVGGAGDHPAEREGRLAER